MQKSENTISTARLAFLAAAVLIVIDQIIKIYVKTHFCLGEAVRVTDWWYLLFVENKGMAFGMTFLGKLPLSLFRLVAIAVISRYLWRITRTGCRTSYALCMAAILAGAAGNMVDSMVYGLVFDASTPWDVAGLVPLGSGYANFLMGKVVDMFYFPLIETTWPAWVPVVGGSHFVFFSPVFNFADACISVGVVVLFLFFRKDFEQTTREWRTPKSAKKS